MLPFWLQVMLFSIPGALIYYGVFYGVPKLKARGVPLVYAFWFSLWAPVFALLPVSLLLFISVEGGRFSLNSIAERFRLFPLTRGDWFIVILGVFVTILTEQLLEPISKRLAKIKVFAPPQYLPAPFNPLRKFSMPPIEFFGVNLKGNWKFLSIFVVFHILAMFSEEMMWRGLILPVQEQIFGSGAWVINGILWAWILHACLKWHFIGMLPGMLVAPFIAQYTGSTWASFAVHAIANSPLWIIMLIGVVGSMRNKTISEGEAK